MSQYSSTSKEISQYMTPHTGHEKKKLNDENLEKQHWTVHNLLEDEELEGYQV